MSAYSKNYFTNGYVEKGDTVYVLSCTIATHQDHRPSTRSYSIEPYIVTTVGRKYLSAKAADKPACRIEKFEPLLRWEPAYGMYLTEAGMPLEIKGWRNRLFLSRRTAETSKEVMERYDAERAARDGGRISADTK